MICSGILRRRVRVRQGDEWMRQGERGERGERGTRSAVQTTIQEGARASEKKIQNVSTPPDGDGIRRE